MEKQTNNGSRKIHSTETWNINVANNSLASGWLGYLMLSYGKWRRRRKKTEVSSCILNVGEMQCMHFFPRCKYVLSAQQLFLHEWHLARHVIIINICQGKYGGLGGVGMEKIPCISNGKFSKHNDLSLVWTTL